MSQQLSSEQIKFKERIEELAKMARIPENMSAGEKKEYEDYISQQNQSNLTPIEQNFLAYLRRTAPPSFKPKLFSFTNAFAKPQGGRRSYRKRSGRSKRKTHRRKSHRRKTHRR